MRIILIGSVNFSAKTLQTLITLNANIVGVCTLKESKLNSDFVDLSAICEEYLIPYLYVDDINSTKTSNWITLLKPDIVFCFGWSRLLNASVLQLAPKGTIGFHPAPLPKNRGRHPITWALVLGLNETASTFFFMDSGIDSGDILSQRMIEIGDDDDAGSLYEKIIGNAIEQIKEFMPLLESDTHSRCRQDDSLTNYWRKRGPVDGVIDWRMSSRSIHNLVRGLAKPYIGASFIYRAKEFKVWKTELHDDLAVNIEPGKVLMQTKKGPVVKCGEGAICLTLTDPKFEPNEGDYL